MTFDWSRHYKSPKKIKHGRRYDHPFIPHLCLERGQELRPSSKISTHVHVFKFHSPPANISLFGMFIHVQKIPTNFSKKTNKTALVRLSYRCYGCTHRHIGGILVELQSYQDMFWHCHKRRWRSCGAMAGEVIPDTYTFILLLFSYWNRACGSAGLFLRFSLLVLLYCSWRVAVLHLGMSVNTRSI